VPGREESLVRLAIINDYQELALKTADWGRLPDSIEIDVFHDQLEAAARGNIKIDKSPKVGRE
jgi:hypothetical protein